MASEIDKKINMYLSIIFFSSFLAPVESLALTHGYVTSPQGVWKEKQFTSFWVFGTLMERTLVYISIFANLFFTIIYFLETLILLYLRWGWNKYTQTIHIKTQQTLKCNANK